MKLRSAPIICLSALPLVLGANGIERSLRGRARTNQANLRTPVDDEDSEFYNRILQFGNSIETPRPTPRPTLSAVSKPPTKQPTNGPTPVPTKAPVPDPTPNPTRAPVTDPTPNPTALPTKAPSTAPSSPPVLDPTPRPTIPPVPDPTPPPVPDPTPSPTRAPVPDPTPPPTDPPVATPAPTTVAPQPTPSACPVTFQVNCATEDGRECSDVPIPPAGTTDPAQCSFQVAYSYTFVNSADSEQQIYALSVVRNMETLVLLGSVFPQNIILQPGEVFSEQGDPVVMDLCNGDTFDAIATVVVGPPIAVNIEIACQAEDGVQCQAIQPFPSDTPADQCDLELTYTYTITNTGQADTTFVSLTRTRNGDQLDLVPLLDSPSLAVGESTQVSETETINNCVSNEFFTRTSVVQQPDADILCNNIAIYEHSPDSAPRPTIPASTPAPGPDPTPPPTDPPATRPPTNAPVMTTSNPPTDAPATTSNPPTDVPVMTTNSPTGGPIGGSASIAPAPTDAPPAATTPATTDAPAMTTSSPTPGPIGGSASIAPAPTDAPPAPTTPAATDAPVMTTSSPTPGPIGGSASIAPIGGSATVAPAPTTPPTTPAPTFHAAGGGPPEPSACPVALQVNCATQDGQECSTIPVPPAGTTDPSQCNFEVTYSYTFVNSGATEQQLYALSVVRNMETIILLGSVLPQNIILQPGEVFSDQGAPVEMDLCNGDTFDAIANIVLGPPIAVSIEIACQSEDGIDCQAIQPFPSDTPADQCDLELTYTYTITNTGQADTTFVALTRTRNGEQLDLVPLLDSPSLAVGESTQVSETETFNNCETNDFTTTTSVQQQPAANILCSNIAIYVHTR